MDGAVGRREPNTDRARGQPEVGMNLRRGDGKVVLTNPSLLETKRVF